MKKFLLFVSLVTVISASAQTVTKKTTLQKGQQIEQVSKVTALITQQMMGQSMEINMESNTVALIEVKDNVADGYKVANTLKKMTMNMNAMGNEQKFDSDKPEDMNGPIGQGLKDKINVTKEYTVDKNGIVTNAPQTKDSAKADPNSVMGNMVNGSMGDEKKGAAYSAFANLPSKGVKVGESWTDSTSDGKTVTKNTYTLRSVTGNNGVVDVKSNLNLEQDIEQQGMSMHMSMAGTVTGEYSFDVNTGLIRSRKLKTEASGNIDVMGQSVPMSISSTVESNSTVK